MKNFDNNLLELTMPTSEENIKDAQKYLDGLPDPAGISEGFD